MATAGAKDALPDGRGYELVTPGADKLGGGVGGSLSLAATQVAENGDGIAYPAYNPFGDASHGMAVLGNSLGYVANRTATGWRSVFNVDVPVPSPALQVTSFNPLWLGSSLDLSRHFLEVDYREAAGFTSGSWASESGRPAKLLAAVDPQAFGFYPTVVGSADDGSGAVLFVPTPLPGSGLAPDAASLLYQETPTGLELVNVDNSGALLNATGAVLASRGTAPGSGTLGSPNYAVNEDGSRVVFFSQTPTADPSDPTSLFVRVDGTRTLEVSANVSGPPGSPAPVSFVGASGDGSRIYFASEAKLLQGATGAGPFLYVYDLPPKAVSGTLRLVAGVEHPVSMTIPSPFGALTDFANVAISEDGLHVYYGNDEDGGSIFSFDVSTGVTQRVAAGVADVSLATTLNGQYNPAPDLSPDGRFLAFISTASLSGAEANPGRKLYLYDADQNRLRLLTPSGPATPSSFDVFFYSAGIVADLTPYRLPSAASFVSDDGQYVFFGTSAPLVDSDINGEPDVYRWHDGTVELLTPGDHPDGAYLLGAGGTGRDVFFYTTASLLARDGDDIYDIYDARVGGGFADEATKPSCDVPDCQGAPSMAPSLPAPASNRTGGMGEKVPARAVPPKLGKPSAAQRRAFARTGRIPLRVTTSRRIAVRAVLQKRRGTQWQTLASRIVVTPSSRPMTVTLSVSGHVRSGLVAKGAQIRAVVGPADGSGPRAIQTFQIAGRKGKS